jgi:pimeloyl-ACP methyl ester carboxylesterase
MWGRIGLIVALGTGAPGQEPVLVPGSEIAFEVRLSDEVRRVIGGGRRVRIEAASVYVALPDSFDSGHPTPIVLVSASGDREYNSSIAWAKGLADAGRAAGWVVVGVDATVPVTPETNAFRYGLAQAALEGLATRWPGAAQAPLALAGFSGGAKYSGYLGAMFARDGRLPVGLFLGGCNEPTPHAAFYQYRPARKAFRGVPVFLSSGVEDRIATPADHERVARVLRNFGFQKVRLESYAGAHVLHPTHLTDALRWFDEVRRQMP